MSAKPNRDLLLLTAAYELFKKQEDSITPVNLLKETVVTDEGAYTGRELFLEIQFHLDVD